MTGNLGRAGYGTSLEGTGPYTYDECDVGTTPNYTLNGLPLAATTQRRRFERQRRALMPAGQRLSQCTRPGESHLGSIYSDGTYGRSAPEIDIFEAQIGTRRFNVYGIEYKRGLDDAYISCIANGALALKINAAGVGADTATDNFAMPVPQEPMDLLMNLGQSINLDTVDTKHMPYPVTMPVDYNRVSPRREELTSVFLLASLYEHDEFMHLNYWKAKRQMSTGAQWEVSVVRVLGICKGIEVHLHGDVHEGGEVIWENNYCRVDMVRGNRDQQEIEMRTRLDYNPRSPKAFGAKPRLLSSVSHLPLAPTPEADPDLDPDVGGGLRSANARL
ncbi:glycoside hydrolase family 16 protein [Athelia psychrophila]|uniref:Glycoside hydrolase family 16 protein n=1 Tax=Athelia psychrophila TaxID=1759441 RepID=A0A165XPL5_9AGAM|nr:glycoside hydrolase family 16 protein [Fibularhizoctonia sp. CBS 109695]